ncbi:MAG: peptide deformylase [Chlamydiia bacterium]|nr:peptide deformylase [Chlamydiia bacterium]
MNLKLLYYGNPLLRRRARPVEGITDEIRELVASMIEVMKSHNGIGLAAPQVGYMVRIFITPVEGVSEQGELILGEPKVFINPELSNPSETSVEMNEGCLSIPKLYAAVSRPLTIHTKALDLNGHLFEETTYGYAARTRMHENDHLNGVLFIDRIKGKQRTVLEPELRRIKQQYKNM